MNISRSIMLILIVVYSIMWIGGILSYVIPLQDSTMQSIGAPLFLWCAVGISLAGASTLALSVRLVLLAVLAFILEIIGVKSGILFGAYQYEAGFGSQIAGVPISIIAAWLILLSYVRHLTASMRFRGITSISVAAIWMVTIDLVIDPVSVGPVRFWTWSGGGSFYGVPMSNFIGWFGVSLLLFSFLQKFREKHLAAHIVGFTVIMFFVMLAIGFSLIIPAVIGILLLLVDIILLHKEWKQYFNSFLQILQKLILQLGFIRSQK